MLHLGPAYLVDLFLFGRFSDQLKGHTSFRSVCRSKKRIKAADTCPTKASLHYVSVCDSVVAIRPPLLSSDDAVVARTVVGLAIASWCEHATLQHFTCLMERLLA